MYIFLAFSNIVLGIYSSHIVRVDPELGIWGVEPVKIRCLYLCLMGAKLLLVSDSPFLVSHLRQRPICFRSRIPSSDLRNNSFSLASMSQAQKTDYT